MKTYLRLLVALAAVAAAVIVAMPATAVVVNTTTCKGTLASGTYDRIVVPMGATCLSDGPIMVSRGLYIGQGATFVLGSEESSNTGVISGGVHAVNAANVQIHFATIWGGLDVRGGFGPFGGPFDVTWNTIEDSVIHGGAVVSGYNGFWAGFIRNTVYGNVNFSNNVLADPDGNEVVTNTIYGNLNCEHNNPQPQVGDSEGNINTVTGRKTGQCTQV
jgi:hypothetical protein